MGQTVNVMFGRRGRGGRSFLRLLLVLGLLKYKSALIHHM